MSKLSWKDGAIFLSIVVLTIVFFREYFFNNRVPLPFNLLVSFYSPWRFEKIQGFENGIANKPTGSDVLKLFYPFRKYTEEIIKKSKIPLWNPYIFAGNVHSATYQAAVYYPLNIIYRILSLPDAWSYLVIVQPILAASFIYLFLRSLELSRMASILGSLSFAFSGWMVSWWEESLVIVHSILWLPLGLYALMLIFARKRVLLGFVLLLLSFTLSILAGFLQMTLYLITSMFAWGVFLSFRTWGNHVFRVLSGICVSVLIISILVSAIHWLPALEAYLLSPRGTVRATFLFENFLMPWKHLITYVAPDFWGNPGAYNYFFPNVFYHEKVIYIGIVPLFFALYAFFYAQSRETKFWKYFSLATLSLGLQLPTSWLLYYARIPVLSAAQPSRVFVLTTFGLSILAAYGFERYKNGGNWQRALKPLQIIVIVLGIAWFVALAVVNYHRCNLLLFSILQNACFRMVFHNGFFLDPSSAVVSLRNLILPTIYTTIVAVALLLLQKHQRLQYFCFVALLIAGSFYFSNKYLYFSERKFEYPEIEVLSQLKKLSGYDRVWGYGDAYATKNILFHFTLYSPEGYDALFPRRYGELLHTISTKGRIVDDIARTDADLKPTTEGDSLADSPIRLRLLSILNVTYILESKKKIIDREYISENIFPPNFFDVVWENIGWRIWQYKEALPRSIIVPNAVVITDRQAIADKLFAPNFDLRSTVILEDKAGQDKELSNIKFEGFSMIRKYEPDEVVIDTKANLGGYLWLSDNYYPGWRAYIDGRATKIYRANYSFRAVRLTKGDHRVVFRYEPNSHILGLSLSILGLLSVFLLGILVYRYQKKGA